MNEGLLRQRRNLIATSAVLTLFDVAKVTVGEVSVLGTNLLIGNPNVVHYFLWLLWLYFLLRYTQYLYDEEDLGLRSGYIGKVAFLLNKKLDQNLKALYPGNEFTNTNYSSLIDKGFLLWELPLQVFDPVPGSITTTGMYRLPRRTMLAAKIRALFHVLVVTPRATDYILPFILAALAPAVTFFWPKV